MNDSKKFNSKEEIAKKKILKELNMSDNNLDEAVGTLNSWLHLQPHLPHVIDQNVLKSFIIGCRSIEVAKEKLEKYFMARINFPAELSNRNPTTIEWDCIQPLAYLPELTPDGYLLLFLTMPDLDKTPKFNMIQSIRFVAMSCELIIREKPYLCGQICITDLKNLSIKLVPKVPISAISNALYLFEHVYPFVMKEICNFNTPQIAHKLQRTFIQPVMGDGLYNMIVSYTENEKVLEKHVPIELLPKDYGGNAPPLQDIMNDWRVKIENAKDMFQEECSLLPDASKVPKKSKSNSQFGSSGTFRKLDID